MKHSHRTIIAMVLSIATLTALSAQGKGKDRKQSAITLLRYEVSVANQGTRSEGMCGKLYFGKDSVPETFDFVEAYGIRYVCTPFTQAWTWHGFSPEKSVVALQTAEESFTSEDAARGWYEGRPDASRGKTPSSWIYAGSETSGAWVDPIRFGDYCESLKE